MTVSNDSTGEATVVGQGGLTGLLADLALTTSADTTLSPVFRTVRLHTEAGRLHGWSTDRYRMAHAAVDATGVLPGAVYLFASDVKRIVSAFRASLELTLRVNRNTGRLEFADRTDTATAPLADVYDNTAELFGRIAEDSVPPSTSVAEINGKYLEEFGKIAKRRSERIALATADKANLPTHVRIGPDYRAWVMPAAAHDVEPAWLASVL
jgi:hypothetical protein